MPETSKKLDDEGPADQVVGALSGYGRCTFLLVALIGLIILYPLGANSRLGEILFIVMGALVYIAGIYLIARDYKSTVLVVAIALAASALEIASILLGREALFNMSVIFSSLLYLAITRHVLHYILIRGPITADKLHGATAVFITLAFLWTGFFVVVENMEPGSFAFPDDPTIGDPWRYYDLLFFSFTTLTTVGYGDIVPVSDYARMLSITEQIVGLFFVAVLIARLAGAYLPHQSADETKPTPPARPPRRGSG